MNTYYSNLIEGHNTRPCDIERALSGELDQNEERRNLQIEAAAHARVQTEIDRMFLQGTLPPATGCLATGGIAGYEAYGSEMRNVSDSTQRRISLSEKRNEEVERHHP
jgi:hypothetical protein